MRSRRPCRPGSGRPGSRSEPSPRGRRPTRIDLPFRFNFGSIRRMKLTLIGAGGFRTPVIYRALAAGDVATRYDEVAFYDIDQGRLDRIGCVLDGITDELGVRPPVTITTD